MCYISLCHGSPAGNPYETRSSLDGANNYSTASGYLQESYPSNCFLSMEIQERDELLVWGLPIVIVWLYQFEDFLRANNFLK